MKRILILSAAVLASWLGMASVSQAQVYVRAPFVRVGVGDGVYVRVPFVNLYVPGDLWSFWKTVNTPPAALLVLSLFLWASPAFSQGCAMCRNAVAATTKEGQKAIGRGVAVLVLLRLEL